MEQYDKFEATFLPHCVSDLKPGAEAWIGPRIGQRLTWQAMWMIDEDEEDGGPYVGQYACVVVDYDPDDHPPFVWVPECDLADKRPLVKR
jgi:hypothetical protein